MRLRCACQHGYGLQRFDSWQPRLLPRRIGMWCLLPGTIDRLCFEIVLLHTLYTPLRSVYGTFEQFLTHPFVDEPLSLAYCHHIDNVCISKTSRLRNSLRNSRITFVFCCIYCKLNVSSSPPSNQFNSFFAAHISLCPFSTSPSLFLFRPPQRSTPSNISSYHTTLDYLTSNSYPRSFCPSRWFAPTMQNAAEYRFRSP